MNLKNPEPTTTIVLPDVLLKEIFEHIPTNLALRLILCATKMCASELKSLNALMSKEPINEEHQVTKEHIEPSIVPNNEMIESMSYDKIVAMGSLKKPQEEPQAEPLRDIKFPGLI